MNDYSFNLPKIETRSSFTKGLREYIIRGYATVPEHLYAYKKEITSDGKPIRTFKEFFTNDCLKKVKEKAKSEKIWVDYGHKNSFNLNVNKLLNDIETRSGTNISEEKTYILDAVNKSDIPLFKLEDIKIDEKGLFVDLRANPFYREVDEEHQKYFDSIWGSLESGFINGMSLNFKPSKLVKIDETTSKIDDIDIYGISLVSGASNEMATIEEVAMRCVETVIKTEEKICPKKRTTSLML